MAKALPPEYESLKMLTIDEVAEYLNVDARTVRRYYTIGDLEYVKFGPNTLRFKSEWIEAFIKRKQGREQGAAWLRAKKVSRG